MKMDVIQEHNYCRLCAALSSTDNLIDLASDNRKREETIKKLVRLSITFDWDNTLLPRTVCFSCDINLNNAFAFVLTTDYAQDELNNIFLGQTVKAEGIKDFKPSHDDFKIESPRESECFEDIPATDIDMEGLIKEEDSNSNSTDIVNVQSEALAILECSKDDDVAKDTITVQNLISTSNKPVISWEDYVWSCTFCPQQYPTFNALKAHSLEDHNCCNSFRCSECGIRKFSLEKFIKHVTKHKPYLKQSCYLCLTVFPFTKNCNKHMNLHYKQTDHICGGCNATFPNAADLAKHTKVYFNKTNQKTSIPMVDKLSDYDNLKCLKCNKTFKLRCLLRRHVIANHIDKNVENVCDKCGKSFVEKGNLIEHVKRHEDLRPFACEICKGAFKTKKQLREHVMTHDAEKPFSCDQCGRCFRLKNQLKSHQLIHTNEMPHVCTFCDKAFRSKYRLKQHLHQHTGDKPYSCDICKQTFANKPNCYKHMKRIHNLDMTRRKRTPDGTFPINPVTGEIIKVQQTSEILEWKEQVLNPRRKGKSREFQNEQHFTTHLQS